MAKKIPKKTSSAKLQPSKSYERFESVIRRSLNLLALQSPVQKLLDAGSQKVDVSDMARSAVVLAVAAMDAYFTGVFAERLVPFLKTKRPSKALINLLQKAGLDTAMALELLSMERPYRRVRKLMDSYHAQHVTQRTEVINELFLAYGLKDFCHNVEKKAKRKTLLSSIRTLTERRHQIVHKGDLNSHGTLQEISRSQIEKRVMDVVKFVASADEILQSQLVRTAVRNNG